MAGYEDNGSLLLQEYKVIERTILLSLMGYRTISTQTGILHT